MLISPNYPIGKAAPVRTRPSIEIGLLGPLAHLSNNVPMARTAPQAKNSTISAVSTTLASKRFIIEPPRTGAATGTYDRSGNRPRPCSPTRFDLQFRRPQSKCAQNDPRWECSRFRYYWALLLSGGNYLKISQITSTINRKTIVSSRISIQRLFWFCFRS